MDRWLNGNWGQRLRELLRRMWLRVTLFSLSGVALAALAWWVGPYLPYVPEIELASGSVDALLNIVASSMLTVTTFSMSIIVGAYGSATTSATPRSNTLLAADPAAQNAVSIFIGSFLFSIVGIIGLSAGLYADQARVLLFAAALIDILLIAWALLRWVDHLNSFGRVSDIIARIEAVADEAAALYRDSPTLGAMPVELRGGITGPALVGKRAGYVRFIDMAGLNGLAEKHRIEVEILRMPGKYVHRDEPLLRVSQPVPLEVGASLCDEFEIGDTRSFDQDLRYGMIVLSEVASKALSAAVNDPGTAVDVLRAGSRVLETLHAPRDGGPEPGQRPGARQVVEHARLRAPAMDVPELYREFYGPILRDGAGTAEVIQTLIDGLEMLARCGEAAPARRLLNDARMRSDAELTQGWERKMVD